MKTVTSLVVDELKDLKLDVSITGTSVKVALECMSCDILAARKMGICFILIHSWVDSLSQGFSMQ